MNELLCERATEVAGLLKLVANEQRLILLCRLREGEASVNELVELCGQSQSGVSQHLGRMRDVGIVKTRRDAKQIFYSLSDPKIAALMDFLCGTYGGAD